MSTNISINISYYLYMCRNLILRYRSYFNGLYNLLYSNDVYIYSSYEYATRVQDPCIVESANIHNNITCMIKYILYEVPRPIKSHNHVTAAATLLYTYNNKRYSVLYFA